MNSFFAGLLMRLFPAAWRARYEEEFADFLQQSPPTFFALFDILICAVRMRLWAMQEGNTMNRIQRALPPMLWAWLIAIAAGINLYVSVDDNPLALVTRSHGAFFTSWMVIECGSVIALAATIAAGVPLLIAMIQSTRGAARRDLIVRLLVPLCAGALLLAWFLTVLIWTRGHWAPMPWAITGDWVASPSWPPLHTRWVFGATTLVLLLIAGVGSAVTVGQAIRSAAFSEVKLSLFHRAWTIHPLRFARRSAYVLAGSILMMTAGVGAWGLFADHYGPAVFHARSGGLLNTTTFVSWLISFTLFAVAAVVSIRETDSMAGQI
jgi:hypothetical protein